MEVLDDTGYLLPVFYRFRSRGYSYPGEIFFRGIRGFWDKKRQTRMSVLLNIGRNMASRPKSTLPHQVGQGRPPYPQKEFGKFK